MIYIKLNERDKMLLGLYDGFYPCCTYATDGNTWSVGSTESTMEFKTYKSFISFIEEETKEALLYYAINGEFDELKKILAEVYEYVER